MKKACRNFKERVTTAWTIPMVVCCVLYLSLIMPVRSVYSVELENKGDKLIFENTSEEKFAKDRIIVKYKKGQSKKLLEQKSRLPDNETLFNAKDLEVLKQIEQLEKRYSTSSHNLDSDKSETVLIKTNNPKFNAGLLLEEYKKLPNVEFAEYDYAAQLQFIPNDPYYSKSKNNIEAEQWGLTLIDSESAWDKIKNGTDKKVVAIVLDTGINHLHPDLKSNILTSYDCTNSGTCKPGGVDTNNHGSLAAGIISAETNNAVGIASVSTKIPVISYKVCLEDGCSWSMVSAALEHAYANYRDKNKVVNMSFGNNQYHQFPKSVIETAISRNFIILASAGNDNSNLPFYPADYPGVISVGASNRYAKKSYYSNWGQNVDISAPGGEMWTNYALDGIYSTLGLSGNNNEGYGYAQGTSFSAPFVTGAAALIWQNNPLLTTSEVKNILRSSAAIIPETGNQWVYGLLDLNRAMAYSDVANFSSRCNQSGTKCLIRWPNTNSHHYDFQLNDLSNDWNCSNPNDTCISLTGNSFVVWTSPDRSYDWWVHSCNESGCSESTHASFTALAGDITGDGKIDYLDFDSLKLKFNTTDSSSDLNSDSKVNLFDLNLIAKNFKR